MSIEINGRAPVATTSDMTAFTAHKTDAAGKEFHVKISQSVAGDPRAEELRQHELANIAPHLFTEPLEREVARLEARLAENVGTDKDGTVLYRLRGRDRENALNALENRRTALAIAQRDRALAERIQAENRKADEGRAARILEAAAKRAEELREAQEAEKLARIYINR